MRYIVFLRSSCEVLILLWVSEVFSKLVIARSFLFIIAERAWRSCSPRERLRSSKTDRVAIIEKLQTLFRGTGRPSFLLRGITHETRQRANFIRQWNTYISREGRGGIIYIRWWRERSIYITYRNRNCLWAMIADGTLWLQAIASSVMRDDVSRYVLTSSWITVR